MDGLNWLKFLRFHREQHFVAKRCASYYLLPFSNDRSFKARFSKIIMENWENVVDFFSIKTVQRRRFVIIACNKVKKHYLKRYQIKTDMQTYLHMIWIIANIIAFLHCRKSENIVRARTYYFCPSLNCNERLRDRLQNKRFRFLTSTAQLSTAAAAKTRLTSIGIWAIL